MNRRSLISTGLLAGAAAVIVSPVRARAVTPPLGVVGWKQYQATHDDFTYYPGMYPPQYTLPGGIFVCSPFAHGETFTKQYDSTALRVNLFGDLCPGDTNSCFTGLFLTFPGTTNPQNWASIAMNGQPGQDMTYCINDEALAGTFPAGTYGTQVYVGLYQGSKPCTWAFAGGTTMKIFEVGLPPSQNN